MASEQIGGAAAAAVIVLPHGSVALRAFLVAFDLDRAGEAWRTIRGHLFVGPYSHVETVVATIIGTSLLQRIEKVGGKINGGGNRGTICHGVAPRRMLDAREGMVSIEALLPLVKRNGKGFAAWVEIIEEPASLVVHDGCLTHQFCPIERQDLGFLAFACIRIVN